MIIDLPGTTPRAINKKLVEVREEGGAVAAVSAQLDASLPRGDAAAIGDSLAIAYEPIWAIGTGKVPTMG